MKKYSVYITTNILNNKGYVGMTNGHNTKYLGSDDILRADVKKYGRENFSQTFLGTFDNKEECHYWEGFYVRTLKTHVSQGGYNKTYDGGPYNTMDGKTHSKKSKKLMSVKKKGKKPWNAGKKGIYSENTLKIMSDKKIGKAPYNKGKKGLCEAWNKGRNNVYTPEQLERMRKSHLLTPKKYCEYCNRFFSPPMYKRWHGENCKSRI